MTEYENERLRQAREQRVLLEEALREKAVYVAQLKAALTEVESLHLKLAACGVAALSDTPKSLEHAKITPDNPAYSASYEDVLRGTQEKIRLRELVLSLGGDPTPPELAKLLSGVSGAPAGDGPSDRDVVGENLAAAAVASAIFLLGGVEGLACPESCSESQCSKHPNHG